jgi:YVTN family beta-propeller protein
MRFVNKLQWIVAGCVAACLTGCSAKPTAPEKATGYRVYVTNEVSGNLSVIDSDKMDVIATVPLGKRPRGIHASPDGKFIYVALSGTPAAPPGVDEDTLPPPDKSADGLAVVDVAQNKVIRVIQAGSDPENFDVSKDGKLIYVSNEDVSGVSVVDIAAGKVINTYHTGEQPEGVTVTPDGKLVYSTCEEDGTIAVIDPAANKVLKIFKVGRRPRNIVFLPDGSKGYVNAENDGGVVLFDAVRNDQVQSIGLGTPGEIKPMGMQLSPDASKLYVSTGRGHKVFVVDTKTNLVGTSLEVGPRPWGIGVSPDGKTLFTANGPSNDISVVDLATNTVTKKIKGGTGTYGLIVLPR